MSAVLLGSREWVTGFSYPKHGILGSQLPPRCVIRHQILRMSASAGDIFSFATLATRFLYFITLHLLAAKSDVCHNNFQSNIK